MKSATLPSSLKVLSLFFIKSLVLTNSEKEAQERHPLQSINDHSL